MSDYEVTKIHFFGDYEYRVTPPEASDFIQTSSHKTGDFLHESSVSASVPVIRKHRFPRPKLPVDHIVAAIQSARSILDLPDNWDDEGAVAVAPATFERATNFLLDGALQLWKLHGICLDAPDISLVADGSIDLHWRKGERELLINVPVDSSESLSYYGDNSLGQIVKGNLPLPMKNLWLLMWLMQ